MQHRVNMQLLNETSQNESFVRYMEPSFRVIDYLMFVAFLCISGAVGIYFSVKGHKNTREYFFGGKKMGAIPVGISNGVSFLSALALIGFPSEIYINGSDILFEPLVGSLAYFLGGALIACVIYPLNMTSLSEYFAKRYNSKLVTYIANIIVLLCIFEYMGSSMLGSIIALNSATGGQISVVVGLVIAGTVGIFYTSIGGLKAVVWTDVIQCGFMLVGILTVVIHAIVDTKGGMTTIVHMNRKYQRIHPISWSLDPTIRHTVWGVTIGKFIYLTMWPIQPAGVQRLCSTRNRRDSLKVAAIAGALYILFSSLPLWAGFNIFGYYASRGCDIFGAGWIKKNEIIMYYVRERINYPGFQGFFIAALFSASLSSFSSGLSAASAILWKDTIKPILPMEVTELRATLISKVLVVAFGVLSMMWCYALHSFGGLILQVTHSFDSSMYGAYFALFMFALFFRNGNYKGALAGLAGSFAFTFWLGLASVLKGQKTVTNWPTITRQCYVNASADEPTSTAFPFTTPSDPPMQEKSLVDSVLSISYMWMPTLCVAVSLTIALMVTGCTGPAKKKVKPKLLFPLCRPNFCGRTKAKRNRDDEQKSHDSDSEGDERRKLPMNNHPSSDDSNSRS